MEKYTLRLYITGFSRTAQKAVENLRRICREDLGGQYDMDVVDILEHPEAAQDEHIIATPTLIKKLPPPLRRVIGDLSDREKVLMGLSITRARGFEQQEGENE